MFKGEHSTTDKILRIIVIVLGLLIFVMIGLIIGGLIFKKTRGPDTKPVAVGSVYESTIEIPKGAEVVQSTVTGPFLLIRVKKDQATEIILINVRDGTMIGRFDITEAE